jgi:hypothetical protein
MGVPSLCVLASLLLQAATMAADPSQSEDIRQSQTSKVPEEATVRAEALPGEETRNLPRFELGARAEVRTGHPESTVTTAATEVEVNPVAAARFPFGPGGLTLAYDPRIFIIASAAPSQRVYYLHRGRFTLDTQTPRARYFLTARGAYGEYDFLPLSTVLGQTSGTGLPPQQQPGTIPTTQPAPVPTPTQGSVPDQRFVKVVDIEGTGGIVYAISPRLSWLGSAGYTYSGGADVVARQSVPLQKGPLGSTGPIWSISPNDTLASLLDASQVSFSSGPHSTIVGLTETWTHQWSRSIQTDLIGGAAGFHNTSPNQPVKNSIYPVGGFAIRQTWIRHLGGLRNSLQFLAAPIPDRLSGIVYEQLNAALVSTWAVNDRLTFNVTGAGAIAVSGPHRDGRLEGRVSYSFAPELVMSVGGRAAWLEGSNLLGSSGFGWVGLLTIATYVGTPL